jgi:hypothetical protein
MGVAEVSRVDRWLAAVTPVVAMVAVGMGLELGGHGGVRAARVYAARPARAVARLAWQVVAAEEDRGVTEPLANADVEVTGRTAGASAVWRGTTNGDGVAEALLALPTTDGITVEVHSHGQVLARGVASAESPATPPTPGAAWAPFARREGPVELAVTVVGERVAPSFPATIWVRAQDAATLAPVAGLEIVPDADTSLSSITPRARTDSRGWAELTATPAGLAASLTLDAHAADGRTGRWIGGLVTSPGAARIATRPRWAPEETVQIDLVAPPTRSAAYIEVDDAAGRAWASPIALAATAGGPPSATVQVPALAPGTYWAVAADDPAGASTMGAGTSVLPFFVARTDDDALTLGPDRDACAVPRDIRESSRALGTCLALAVLSPVPRWLALDGFVAQRAQSADRRRRGLAVALAGVAIAVLLEGALLLRAAAAARAAVQSAVPVEARRWGVVVALLVGLLGFALLAAFLVRLS